MRTFNATFEAARNKRSSSPVNLVEIQFPAGTQYLSDRTVTPPGGQTYRGLVKSWGFIDSDKAQATGLTDGIDTPDFQMVLVNSTVPPVSASFDELEEAPIVVHQWFMGTPDSAKELIFKGAVTGNPTHTLTEATVTVSGVWAAMDKLIGQGSILTSADYPELDPDDVGKMGNIVLGAVDHVPARAVESGAVSTLTSDRTAAHTSLLVSDTSRFDLSGTVGVDNEYITYTGKSASALTGCTRGASGTTAASHRAGSNIWQVTSRFVYQVASHPVSSIGDCFVDGVKIEVATTYTGQAGNELAGYEGQAVFTVPARLTRQQAIDLLIDDGLTIDDATAVVDALTIVDGVTVDDGLTINDGIAVVDGVVVNDGITISDLIGVSSTINVSDTITVNDGIDVSTGSHSHDTDLSIAILNFDTITQTEGGPIEYLYNIVDKNLMTYGGDTAGSDCVCTIGFGYTPSYPGPPTSYRLCLLAQNINDINRMAYFYFGGHAVGATQSSDNNVVQRSAYYNVTAGENTWSELAAMNGTLNLYDGAEVIEAWLEVRYTPTSDASPATGVAKTGSATKGGTVTRTGTVSKSGTVSRDGSVSKSGTVSKNGTVSRSGTVSKNGTVSRSGTVSKNGTVTRSGAITLSGNSVADVEIGRLVTVHVIGGAIDDAGGSTTGTPYAVIERPDHVFKYLWTAYLGGQAADFATDAAAYFATNNYAFGLLLDAPVQASTLFPRLALQCRCRFMVRPNGQAELILRQAGVAAEKSIAKGQIKADSVSMGRSDSRDLLNAFVIYFDLDNRLSRNSQDSYRAATVFQDAPSIAKYGERTPSDPQALCFDAVRDPAMVDDIGAFLLAWFGKARKMPKFTVFLDNMELEPGDVVGLTHPLDAMAGMPCEIMSVRQILGSGRDGRMDTLQITAIDNTT